MRKRRILIIRKNVLSVVFLGIVPQSLLWQERLFVERVVTSQHKRPVLKVLMFVLAKEKMKERISLSCTKTRMVNVNVLVIEEWPRLSSTEKESVVISVATMLNFL